jgi:hypothetical protein
MNWMLLDDAGNAFGTYDDEISAFVALRSLVVDEGSEVADHVLLLAYDEAGQPVGEALTFGDLPMASFSLADTSPGGQQIFWAARPTRGFGGVSTAVDGIARPRTTGTVAV